MDKLTQEFMMNWRHLHGTPLENLNSYNKMLRSLSPMDQKKFKKMYLSRHGSIPTRKSAVRDEKEYRALESLSKTASDSSCNRDYKKEYLRDHASRKAKVNRAKRNLWNRRLKGKVPAGQEIDHKVPLSKGGGNGSNNIRYRSVSANRSDNQMNKSAMNKMDRKLLGEVYRRLLKERARAKAQKNEEMVRLLNEELLELQLLLEGPRIRSTLD